MKKIGIIVLFVVFAAAFLWLQRSIVRHREYFRVEEKILVVADDPEVAKIGALGFDNLLADFSWIRAIQFFGGNFTTLDRPKKRDGFERLMKTLVALDERFVSAWKFGGFAFHEAIGDATLAIDFLTEGTDKNPGAWQLPFDAGFICYYRQGDTARAKEFFEEAYSRSNFTSGRLTSLTFDAKPESEGDIRLIPNVDASRLGEISGLFGSIPHTLAAEPPTVQTATAVLFSTSTRQASSATLEIHVASNTQKIAAFDLRVAYDPSVYKYRSASAAPELGHGTFTVRPSGDGELTLSGDYIDPSCPPYVPRMAIEMDYAAGKFISAWKQYVRYYESAMKRGDQISATIAGDKLTMIYSEQATKILMQAVETYHKEKGAYPSADMHELLESNILFDTVKKLLDEDPSQLDVIRILTYGTSDIRHLFTEWRHPDVEKPEPHILIIRKVDDQEIPRIYNRHNLFKQQKSISERLQGYVRAFAQEKGNPPSTIKDLDDWLKERIFTQEKGRPPESPQELQEWCEKIECRGLPEDPLGGEYYLDEDGKVQIRNLKY